MSGLPLYPRAVAPRRLLSAVALCAFFLGAAVSAALAYTVANRTDYAAGTNPIATATADFDWDGDADLVVANFGSDNITYRPNTGGGTFGAPVDYAVGDGPYDVAAVDVDGDYRADVVAVNYWANTVSVLINNGAGGFFAKVDYPCGINPTGIGVGDVDGDTFSDIVAVNYWQNGVSVLLNFGAGTFDAPTAVTTAAGPQNVALGDLDGDGDLDLVTCNSVANNVSVLKNAAGVFGLKTDYPTGALPYTVALGDVNNDGSLDIATANYNDSNVSVLLANPGPGTYGPKVDFATGAGTTWVELLDVNLDRRLDIVTSDYDAQTATVLQGNGLGSFASAASFAVGTEAWGIAAGDLSGDGIIDIVVANYGAGTATVLRGDLPGGFAIGDTAVAFKALDQNGVERSLADFAGKWVVLDLMAMWCGPCNQMGLESQQVYDSWVSHPTVHVEYLTAMVQGPTVSPSTQARATTWGCKYKISRPILHAEGKYPNTLDSYYQGIDGTGFPTLALVDPLGKVRDIFVGPLTGQEINDRIATLAGVSSPALAPPPTSGPCPPPPPPSGGVKPIWMPLADATMHLTYNGLESIAPVQGTFEPDEVSRVIDYQSWDTPPAGVPQPDGQIYAVVDSLTGIESLEFVFSRLDGYDIPYAEPWSAQLTGMTWPDGLARTLVQPTNPVVSTVYLSEPGNFDSPQTWFGTPLNPALSLAGNVLTIAPFDLSTVPGLPPAPAAWVVQSVNVRHLAPLDVPTPARAGHLLLSTAWPNPARLSTRLRWALPASALVRIEVVDVSGRLVRLLLDGIVEEGPQVTNWDLNDEAGHRVRPGVYFAKVNTGGESAVTRIAVMR